MLEGLRILLAKPRSWVPLLSGIPKGETAKIAKSKSSLVGFAVPFFESRLRVQCKSGTWRLCESVFEIASISISFEI